MFVGRQLTKRPQIHKSCASSIGAKSINQPSKRALIVVRSPSLSSWFSILLPQTSGMVDCLTCFANIFQPPTSCGCRWMFIPAHQQWLLNLSIDQGSRSAAAQDVLRGWGRGVLLLDIVGNINGWFPKVSYKSGGFSIAMLVISSCLIAIMLSAILMCTFDFIRDCIISLLEW